MDRVIVSSINMLAYLEDLDERVEYGKLKDETEELLKLYWSPTAKSFFDLTVNQGSLRTRLIKYTSKYKKSDFHTANMTQEQIEEQVESNAGTFKITELQRIKNLRNDIKSTVAAAKFRITVCKHFELLQNLKHTFKLETLYSIDPDRVGSCNRFGYKSVIQLNDFEAVIEAFKSSYCGQCNYQEPVARE